MTPDEIKQLETMLPIIQDCFTWMLKDITMKSDMVNVGNYSDELKTSISSKEWLDKFLAEHNQK
jgi:hypothetical protein